MQNALEQRGRGDAGPVGDLDAGGVRALYPPPRACATWKRGGVVIFAAGTGNPFFTTDTAAALRASEMGCDALLKATKVDGVYDADPHRVAGATRFERLDYHEVLARDLQVMDASAISLARENRIPILVFSIFESGGFAEVVRGQGRYTIIDERELSASTEGQSHARRRAAQGSRPPDGRRARRAAQGIRRAAHRPRLGRACWSRSPSPPMAARCRSTSWPMSACPSRA